MVKEDLVELRGKFEAFAKSKARENLQAFTAYTKKDYTFIWFHKLICKYLTMLERGDIKKLMIFVPPQHGKSELSSRRFPAFCLGRNPKVKVAIGSYSADLANTFNRDVQNIIDSPEYKKVFPKTKLKGSGGKKGGERRNNSFFEVLGAKGSLKTVGIKGGLTGHRVDIGIIDDPFSGRQEANSRAARERVWYWYQEVFLQRLHNDSKQLLLFTRWHEDDIAGRLINPKNPHYDEEEAKEWVILALPALKEVTKPLPQALEIKDTRLIGEALWEVRHSRRKYEKMKRVNPTGFSSLAQQRPTAEGGNKIKKEWFIIKKEGELPFNPRLIVPDYFLDGAFTESTKNDETGLGAFYYHKPNKTLYVLNCIGVRKELYELLTYFRGYVLQNGYKPSSTVYIELKASGHPLKSMLKKVEYGGFNVRGINTKTVSLGKYNRVENSEPFLAGGRVVLVEGGWNSGFIEQCCSFPNGANDDRLDVFCYAIDKYFLGIEGGGVSYN